MKAPNEEKKNWRGGSKTRLRKKRVSDVTRDSVIITRDLPVIRDHTNHKSQCHKVEMNQQLKESMKLNDLNFGRRR